ncbi:mCG2736, isoform CRA_b [Mus musculus]|nr:mCG2736, isoform CRA_b [Mus musculus]
MLDTELSSLTDSVMYRTLWSGKGLISSSLGYRNQLSLTAALDHGMYQSSLVAKTCRTSISHSASSSGWWPASFLISTPALR